MIRALVALALAGLLASPAEAHSAFPGAGDFYNGMLHPLLVPAHLLALIGLGLVVGQHAPRSSQFALPVFAITLIVFSILPPAFPSVPEVALLALALVSGAAVALAINAGAYLPAVIAAGVAVLLAVGARLDAVADGQSWTALAGTALSSFVAVALIGGAASWLREPWQKIGVRVLGSWIAASAFLVIALAFAPARPA